MSEEKTVTINSAAGQTKVNLDSPYTYLEDEDKELKKIKTQKELEFKKKIDSIVDRNADTYHQRSNDVRDFVRKTLLDFAKLMREEK